MELTRPFLKWPGNKFRMLSKILPFLPKGSRLVEPFGGTCAISLNSNYDDYLIGEINGHLISLYKILQTDSNFIAYARKKFEAFNDSESYYNLRNIFNTTTNIKLRCALFIYLNRHGFNGLCRYNLSGKYNVPFGRYINPKFPELQLQNFIKKTKDFDFIKCNFAHIFSHYLKKDDVVYCDPPYLPINKKSFTNYSPKKFDMPEHLNLIKLAKKAQSKGVTTLISNHSSLDIDKLYKDACFITKFTSPRLISQKLTSIKPVLELLAVFKAK
jgi:DNA adenine methylase